MTARNITDRAKRYRANRTPPPGPKRCNFCPSRQNVDIDHVTGDESDGSPANLIYLCRSCNTTKGIIQARNRIGVRTRQYNGGIPSLKRFKAAAAVLLGKGPGDVGEATELVRVTPPGRRAQYAAEIARNPAPTYEQYLHAVTTHTPKAHDEGGAIIHATPARLRSQYAEKIWEARKAHGGRSGRR